MGLTPYVTVLLGYLIVPELDKQFWKPKFRCHVYYTPSLILKMQAALFSETSAILYQTALRHVQHDDSIRVNAAAASKLARYDMLFCWAQTREGAIC